MREAQVFKQLLPLLKLYPRIIFIIIILGILSSIFEGLGISLFIPLLQSFIETKSPTENSNFLLSLLNRIFINISTNNRLLIISSCILGSIFLKNCLIFGNAILFGWLSSRIGHRLRSGVFKQLLSVSYSFIENNDSGKLINILASETWQTTEALSNWISLIITISTIAIYVSLLLLISWQITLLVAVLMVLISFVIQLVTRQVKNLGEEAVEANSTLTNRMWEGLAGMKEIRAFRRENYEQRRFDTASKNVVNTFFKLDIISGIVNPISEVLSGFVLVSILVIALLQNHASLPNYLSFILILYRLQPKVQHLDGIRVNLVSLTSAVQDVISFLDYSDKPYIRSGNIHFKSLEQGIYFKSVSFLYNPLEEAVIKNVSISIPAGKTTAIVGPSGAGKSTIIGLICRFYEVTTGEIYTDSYPLRELNLTDWRNKIAIVSQDIYMFSTTVLENIAYGRLDATKNEIIAAAKLANAHDFIQQLPQSYDTKVGDRGIRLSGGQRQRIALARAIVRNPQILILDEATNALDSISEHLIQEALNTLSQNRTVIVIAHRLSTIEQADQIIVLNEGQVIEQGNLEHLLTLNGLFAKLYNLQHRNAKI
ncbi:ABC transporter ATP-binding protein [aff. Roholtiella sp. LEGE 12411]|uniref:ABC transporter ATP-binding protein n=1 Tax=aff. Roholtiella sp. LEGE 12411 TaxID=1828822 RepID=UPI0018826069|nr:ABC transporter ATP-binding protein [aff. Roholtiella sp. LEGE 12411]MBE9034288.1 ABC transporter ATP-binding protein [aff. Roholtiella sp. LEGE 12411]